MTEARKHQQRAGLRKYYKKLLRRVPEPEDVAYLNITPMLDMMTIILVFFLMNFSVTVTNVNVSEELALPGSSSQINPHQAVGLTITKNGILVEDVVVASIKNGRVDASLKRDGEDGYFINTLHAELDKHRERLQKIAELSRGAQPFRGEITVICDRTTPYRLLTEVLYTAGQAEFNRYRLLVLQKSERGAG